MVKILVAIAGSALAACGSFEDPAIVIDLRPIAIAAFPPEQVLPVDPDNPTNVRFRDVTICTTAADPQRRPLAWRLMVCPPTRDLRCTDLEAPFLVVEPPVTNEPPLEVSQSLCTLIPAGPTLTAIIRRTIEDDSLSGFGGVDINVSVRAVPIGGDEADAVYAAKAVRFSPQIPADRVANHNPVITEVAAQIDRGAGLEPAIVMPTGGCFAPEFGLQIPESGSVKLAPRALDGSEEMYVVPTFEGGSRTFIENLRYQWLATAGSWSRDATGGPRDPAGNPAAVSSVWHPPALRPGQAARLVDMWMIQRDERGGASWISGCLVVVPDA
jgi:hypothetical protein